MEAKRKKLMLGITQSNFGGAQRNVYDLAVGFKDKFDVAVVYGGDGMLAKKLEEAGVRGIPMQTMVRQVSPISEWRSLIALARLLKKEKPDIWHVHSSKMGGLGVVAGRIAGVPRIIFTAHGWEFNAPRPWRQRRVIAMFSTLIVLLSHQTIAVSEAARKAIRCYLARRKMIVVHNGLRPFEFLSREEARRRLMERCSALTDGVWIGSASELHPVKGLSFAIEAIATLAKEFPELRYVLMGEGKERQKLEAHIRERGLEGSVMLLGQIDDARTCLRALDVFLMPSISEALSYGLIEAGFAGLPAVATRVGGITEVVDDTTGILVPPRDADAIAEALRRLLKDPALAARLGSAFEKKAAREFSIERMLEETKKVYLS